MNVVKPTYTQEKVLEIYLNMLIHECAASAPLDVKSEEYQVFLKKTVDEFTKKIVDKLNRPECITEKD